MRIWTALLILFLVVMALPTAFSRGLSFFWGGRSGGQYLDVPVRIFFPRTGEIAEISLEEYVKGVTAAEMPHTFEVEALKAQMLVARTYAVRRMRAFGGSGCGLQPAADVCVGPEHGQAYLPWQELQGRLGAAGFVEYRSKLEAANAATRGLIITYQGEPIDALYHSTSIRSTEDAAAVWGAHVPYLRAVSEPFGTSSPRATETLVLSPDELARRLGVRQAQPIQVLERTPGGRVKTLAVGGQVFTGPEFRTRLGLRSTDFNITIESGQVRITTYGFGHGVGMSQYGANEMALAGRRYPAIIAHYYQGVKIERMFDE